MTQPLKHTLTPEVAAKLTALSAPMREQIKWKIQTILKPRDRDKSRYALLVAYIDARDVSERLDNVAGFDWSAEYNVLQDTGKTLVVECELTVFGVTRVDVGTTDKSDANAFKSAYSDALKRAAVHFGVGRQVYRLPLIEGQVDVWTGNNGKENARILRETDEQLETVTGKLLAGEKPGTYSRLRVLSDGQRAELPSYGLDDTDSETTEPGTSDGDRTLTGHECAAIMQPMLKSGMTEDDILHCANHVLQRPITSMKDVRLSEKDQVILACRAYYTEHVAPRKGQQAAN